MSDELIDVRTPLAVSPHARVEIGQDGVVHVLAGPVTLHLDRAVCQELTTTLAIAMVRLDKVSPVPNKRARLRVVPNDSRAAESVDCSITPHGGPGSSAADA